MYCKKSNGATIHSVYKLQNFKLVKLHSLKIKLFYILGSDAATRPWLAKHNFICQKNTNGFTFDIYGTPGWARNFINECPEGSASTYGSSILGVVRQVFQQGAVFFLNWRPFVPGATIGYLTNP